MTEDTTADVQENEDVATPDEGTIKEVTKPESKNAKAYEQAAENFVNDSSLTQKAAVESVGLKSNAYNCRMTMALVDPEIVKARAANRSPDSGAIKAAAEAFAADGSLSKKAALEAQDVNYNGYRVKKMDIMLADMVVVAREKKPSATNESILAAAQAFVASRDSEGETITKKKAMEENDVIYNAYNIGKLNTSIESIGVAV